MTDGRRAHEREESRREQRAGGAEHDRHDEGEDQRLHRGARGALGILLADAARDHRGRADAEAHRQRVDHGEQRLGERRREATASGPRCETQKMSATAKTLSSTTSSTIGTASSRIARPIGPSVKSWCTLAADRFLDDGPEADRFGAAGRRRGWFESFDRFGHSGNNKGRKGRKGRKGSLRYLRLLRPLLAEETLPVTL